MLYSGIKVGNELIREVLYADDITLVNPISSELNLGLGAVYKAGIYDAFKFKAGKCKVVGAEVKDKTIFRMGNEEILRAPKGVLLGAVIKMDGIFVLEHVIRKAKMVKGAVKQLKKWRDNSM